MSHSGSDNPAGPGAAVDLGVFGQVVTAGELLLAQRALVRLDAGVRAAVTRQLVRPREPGDTRAGGWSKEHSNKERYRDRYCQIRLRLLH